MSFRILLVTATTSEVMNLWKIPGMISHAGGFTFGNTEISLLVTGVGSMSTSWSMVKWLISNHKPDLAINIGIAGSFKDDLKPGEVVMPVYDCFADAGIEDGEKFHTLAEAGLAAADDFPFRSGFIEADKKYSLMMEDLLKPVRAISVNCATGSETTRQRLSKKFNPDIETMEGATFFYICASENIPFLALRGISNKVETRNKNNWNIPLAMKNLSEKFKEVIIRLE